MSQSLHSRVEALERAWRTNSITFEMADGSTRTVTERRLLQMLEEISRGHVAPDTREVAESISSNCYAIGAGHLDELIRIWWMSRRHIDKGGR